MGELNNLPENSREDDPVTAEQVLRNVTQDLRSLQQDLVSQMSQDISRLQTERSRLINEIEKLQAQQQMLQSEHQVLLTQQQLAQQRAWAKQLAQALAGHLYNILVQRLGKLPTDAPERADLPPAANGYSPVTAQALMSLDDTLNQTLTSLQRDLGTYQSSLSQQISRMQTMEQQGEAILEALVSRLNQRLQAEAARTPTPDPAGMGTPLMGHAVPPGAGFPPSGFPPANVPPPSVPAGAVYPPNGPTNGSNATLPSVNSRPPGAGYPPPNNRPSSPVQTLVGGDRSPNKSWLGLLATLVAGILVVGAFFLGYHLLLGIATAVPQLAGIIPFLALLLLAGTLFLIYQRVLAPAKGKPLSLSSPAVGDLRSAPFFRRLPPAQLGLALILCSTLALSLHNVVVGIIGGPTSIFGIFKLEGSITLNSLSDSLLILWLRMLVVVPLMVIIAKILHPPAWQDVKAFCLSPDRRLQINVIGSGAFLFLSQILIYIAIAATSPGVAVTILFMYPLITVPLAWFLFGDKPSALRWVVMFSILVGVILTAFPKLAASTNISSGGVVAAIFSGIFFALYLISMQISFRKLHPVPVSLIQFVTIFVLTNILLLPFGVQEPPSNLSGLILGGIVLGSLTLVGYLLNNLGVKFMGAARASIIASSGPVLTALLAFLITPSNRTLLQPVQILGILIVTLSVLGLSFERMWMQSKASKAK